MQLSNNFTLSEFIISPTAKRLGIDNTPTDEVKTNLQRLCFEVLQPLRNEYNKPIVVNSGYRCKALNKAVGGSSSSYHLGGYAADIRSVENTKQENKRLFDLIQQMNLPFTELINEYDYSWIHVSYNGINRRLIKHIGSF